MWSVSWVAVRGKPVGQILRELEFEPMPGPPHGEDASVRGALLNDGWYLVYVDDSWHEQLTPFALEQLSRQDTIVLHSVVEEVQQISSVCQYHDGQASWLVMHDGAVDPEHLAIAGSAPEELDTLLAYVRQENIANGSYQIPIALGAVLCGFAHNQRDDPPAFVPLREVI